MKKFFLLLISSLLLHSSELDLGLGGGAMFYPDYLGSKNNNILFIPYPYISYKSEKLNIDREGLKKKFLNYGNFSLEVSAAGSLPVSSSGAREGMNDLDPALELGPALIYTAYQNETLSLKIDLPLRAVISTDFKGVDYRGYIYELRGELEYKLNDYEVQFHTGFMYSDMKYHDYLYGVKTNDITTSRASYQAKAGYTAYKTSLGLSKRFDNIWAGAFIRHYSLNESSIASSPLVERNSALYGGAFIAYIFDDGLTRSIKNWLE
jgi:outer membrane scaffolding protein for murein synthesis (MipA/OmpV family)